MHCEGEDDDIYSIVICCAGCSFDHFQPLLNTIHKFGEKKGELTVVLEPERDYVRVKQCCSS